MEAVTAAAFAVVAPLTLSGYAHFKDCLQTSGRRLAETPQMLRDAYTEPSEQLRLLQEQRKSKVMGSQATLLVDGEPASGQYLVFNGEVLLVGETPQTLRAVSAIGGSTVSCRDETVKVLTWEAPKELTLRCKSGEEAMAWRDTLREAAKQPLYPARLDTLMEHIHMQDMHKRDLQLRLDSFQAEPTTVEAGEGQPAEEGTASRAPAVVRAPECLEENGNGSAVYLVRSPDPEQAASHPGVAHRHSTNLDDKADQLAQWGSTVVGVDVGEGWVKVGQTYLPKTVGDIVVLEKQEPAAVEKKEDGSGKRVRSLELESGGPVSPGRATVMVQPENGDVLERLQASEQRKRELEELVATLEERLQRVDEGRDLLKMLEDAELRKRELEQKAEGLEKRLEQVDDSRELLKMLEVAEVRKAQLERTASGLEERLVALSQAQQVDDRQELMPMLQAAEARRGDLEAKALLLEERLAKVDEGQAHSGRLEAAELCKKRLEALVLSLEQRLETVEGQQGQSAVELMERLQAAEARRAELEGKTLALERQLEQVVRPADRELQQVPDGIEELKREQALSEAQGKQIVALQQALQEQEARQQAPQVQLVELQRAEAEELHLRRIEELEKDKEAVEDAYVQQLMEKKLRLSELQKLVDEQAGQLSGLQEGEKVLLMKLEEREEALRAAGQSGEEVRALRQDVEGGQLLLQERDRELAELRRSVAELHEVRERALDVPVALYAPSPAGSGDKAALEQLLLDQMAALQATNDSSAQHTLQLEQALQLADAERQREQGEANALRQELREALEVVEQLRKEALDSPALEGNKEGDVEALRVELQAALEMVEQLREQAMYKERGQLEPVKEVPGQEGEADALREELREALEMVEQLKRQVLETEEGHTQFVEEVQGVVTKKEEEHQQWMEQAEAQVQQLSDLVREKDEQAIALTEAVTTLEEEVLRLRADAGAYMEQQQLQEMQALVAANQEKEELLQRVAELNEELTLRLQETEAVANEYRERLLEAEATAGGREAEEPSPGGSQALLQSRVVEAEGQVAELQMVMQEQERQALQLQEALAAARKELVEHASAAELKAAQLEALQSDAEQHRVRADLADEALDALRQQHQDLAERHAEAARGLGSEEALLRQQAQETSQRMQALVAETEALLAEDRRNKERLAAAEVEKQQLAQEKEEAVAAAERQLRALAEEKVLLQTDTVGDTQLRAAEAEEKERVKEMLLASEDERALLMQRLTAAEAASLQALEENEVLKQQQAAAAEESERQLVAAQAGALRCQALEEEHALLREEGVRYKQQLAAAEAGQTRMEAALRALEEENGLLKRQQGDAAKVQALQEQLQQAQAASNMSRALQEEKEKLVEEMQREHEAARRELGVWASSHEERARAAEASHEEGERVIRQLKQDLGAMSQDMTRQAEAAEAAQQQLLKQAAAFEAGARRAEEQLREREQRLRMLELQLQDMKAQGMRQREEEEAAHSQQAREAEAMTHHFKALADEKARHIERLESSTGNLLQELAQLRGAAADRAEKDRVGKQGFLASARAAEAMLAAPVSQERVEEVKARVEEEKSMLKQQLQAEFEMRYEAIRTEVAQTRQSLSAAVSERETLKSQLESAHAREQQRARLLEEEKKAIRKHLVEQLEGETVVMQQRCADAQRELQLVLSERDGLRQALERQRSNPSSPERDLGRSSAVVQRLAATEIAAEELKAKLQVVEQELAAAYQTIERQSQEQAELRLQKAQAARTEVQLQKLEHERLGLQEQLAQRTAAYSREMEDVGTKMRLLEEALNAAGGDSPGQPPASERTIAPEQLSPACSAWAKQPPSEPLAALPPSIMAGEPLAATIQNVVMAREIPRPSGSPLLTASPHASPARQRPEVPVPVHRASEVPMHRASEMLLHRPSGLAPNLMQPAAASHQPPATHQPSAPQTSMLMSGRGSVASGAGGLGSARAAAPTAQVLRSPGRASVTPTALRPTELPQRQASLPLQHPQLARPAGLQGRVAH